MVAWKKPAQGRNPPTDDEHEPPNIPMKSAQTARHGSIKIMARNFEMHQEADRIHGPPNFRVSRTPPCGSRIHTLETMAINPIRFLVTPKFLAMMMFLCDHLGRFHGNIRRLGVRRQSGGFDAATSRSRPMAADARYCHGLGQA